ncbi:hypothetical protein B0I29_10921 [Actinoplanes lutulentus]|uniref:Uncharacterized protein n=1 Tax=Actinoplanes lutulentus TaxID=1287878 RepID=A0A327ZAY3_9ACTN|nr:hypothetical protein B0I29_10921 [Actinoplanes lutulentus]
MADTAPVTSTDDNAQPEEKQRKPFNTGWALPVAGLLFGAYFLVSAALTLREKHGNGLFALLIAGIVIIVGGIGAVLFRTYRAEKAAQK